MIGGSIESISLAGRSFAVPADLEANVTIGGFKNERRANGNGTGRNVRQRMPWKIAGLQVAMSFANGDPAFLQNLADGPDFAVTVTFADDSVLNGTGSIEGDLTFSSQASTASLELAGSGTLTA